jgi:hypothetical protein
MSSHVRRRAFRIWAAPFVASACLLWECHANAQSADDLPNAAEPWLAEEGDWAADFNEAQVACYQGSMGACDSIWSSDRVLTDTFLYEYGRTCGGRVDRREIVQAGLSCADAFPGHE